MASASDRTRPAKKGAATSKKSTRTRAASTTRTRSAATKRKPVTLLTGGNPQIAKADGDAPVRAYIAAIPGWRRDLARQLDALIVRTVPGVKKAVKWNSPFYGVEGLGWFASLHVFTNYIKLTFFSGTELRPPPSGGAGPEARWINIHPDNLDEEQLVAWIRQAAAIPGWMI